MWLATWHNTAALLWLSKCQNSRRIYAAYVLWSLVDSEESLIQGLIPWDHIRAVLWCCPGVLPSPFSYVTSDTCSHTLFCLVLRMSEWLVQEPNFSPSINKIPAQEKLRIGSFRPNL